MVWFVVFGVSDILVLGVMMLMVEMFVFMMSGVNDWNMNII